MNIVAYCRVSTDKADQLNSLETQKQFFEEYAQKNGHTLVRIYADEGISGTKKKNRKEFLCLMRDSKYGLFQMVVVKDISRLARNTVDFLESIRELKMSKIEVLFLTSNMTILGDSEFSLTIFAAMAQEESANTSKRVKFGKHRNAEKGRVPNIVYGYEKTKGDYFNLEIKEDEAEIVRDIYDMYINQGYGALRIAQILNNKGLKTKRNSSWTQNAIARVLKNELYIGKIINRKEEVTDFLTGKREKRDESEWIIIDRPELQIIEPLIFKKAQEIFAERCNAFHINRERQSNKHLFSTLIKCAECGYSFRRTEHTYKNTYVRWVCSGRNAKGTGSCGNKTVIDEADLISELKEYFKGVINDKSATIKAIKSDFIKTNKARADNEQFEYELRDKLSKLKKAKQKYMDMYVDEVITREEMNEKTKPIIAEIERAENDLGLITYNIDKSDLLEEIISKTFNTAEDIVAMEELTNAQLKQVIEKIVVSNDSGIDVYLRLFGDIGLNETSLITHNRT